MAFLQIGYSIYYYSFPQKLLGDARRSKLTIVNQNAGPDKISLYNGQKSQRQFPIVSQPQKQIQQKPLIQTSPPTAPKPVTNFVNKYNPDQITTTKPTIKSVDDIYTAQKKDDYSKLHYNNNIRF